MDFDIINETISTQNTTLLTINSTGGIGLPSGTSAQRPVSAVAGAIRWNTSSTTLEFYNGTSWNTVGSGSGGVTSVGLAMPSIFTVSGSPITTSGTLTASLATQSANLVLVGPASGAAATPTFRTLALATNDVSDVLITSPSVNQVLAWNGVDWVNTGAVGANATGTVGVSPTGGGTGWTFISGTRYYADFAHNLGTTNVVITLYDTSTNAVFNADSIVTTNSNSVRVTVIGNTRTIKVVVVANGQSIVAGGSTPSSVVTAQDGVTVSTVATKLNFTGTTVMKVTDAGSGTTNISIGSRFIYFANSLDSPNNSDFAISALAPVATDPSYTSLNIRQFSNTIEQGVGFTVSIPTNATQVTFKFRGRAQTAPGSASVVQPRIYYRLIPNNAAIGAWSIAQELSNINIPTNANFQYAQQTILLSTLGMTAGNMYQVELTRRVSGVTGTNLASNFLLAEVDAEFA